MYWFREIVGWFFILLGLWLFYVSYFVLMQNNLYVQATPTVIMGLVIFRGGIHFLKISLAARVARQPPIEEQRTKSRVTPKPGARRTVVPGKR